MDKLAKGVARLFQKKTKCECQEAEKCSETFGGCAEKGHIICLDWHLANNVNEIDEQDTTGRTPLLRASAYGQYECVKKLIAAKANINLCDKEGETPLHRASQYGQDTVVKILLLAGAEKDVNLGNVKGFTPLHFAALKNRDTCCFVLLSAKANIEAKTREMAHPLHFASVHGGLGIGETTLALHVLLEAKADVDVLDCDGASPICYAAQSEFDQDEVINMLLNYKANPDIIVQTQDGGSPLHYAARNGHYRMIQALLKAGADNDIINKNGKSPSEEAKDDMTANQLATWGQNVSVVVGQSIGGVKVIE